MSGGLFRKNEKGQFIPVEQEPPPVEVRAAEVRAALAYDLIDKIDMAIVTLNIQTVGEVRALLTGMREAAKEARDA